MHGSRWPGVVPHRTSREPPDMRMPDNTATDDCTTYHEVSPKGTGRSKRCSTRKRDCGDIRDIQ